MATRGTERWRRTHWGEPCRANLGTVTVGRAVGLKVDRRALAAFAAFETVRARHGYDVRPAYPAGDTATYNCRHIGNDPRRPWSAHAWAIAIDVNWRTNPDGSRLVTDIPPAMIDDIHAIACAGGAPVWRWGGDWDRDPRTGHSYLDAMHFEVIATPAELAAGIAGPAGTLEDEEDDVIVRYGDRTGIKAVWVKRLQARLNITRQTYWIVSDRPIKVDGWFGDETADALAGFLNAQVLPGQPLAAGLAHDGRIYGAAEAEVLTAFIAWADTDRKIAGHTDGAPHGTGRHTHRAVVTSTVELEG